MATILLSAAGAAIGGSVGGTFAGLSSAVIGRAVGATLGRVIDQRLLGQGSEAIESGKVDRFRLTGTGEGEAINHVYGRMRIGGHLIWSSDFSEAVSVSGGGKGAPSQPETREYSYSVSIAVALCAGVITRVGRVWADGVEVAPDDLNMQVYYGTADQEPDPVMSAIEGEGQVPAYRGTAYVVMENLALQAYGNRVPQFSFEVIRPEQEGLPDWQNTPTHGITGVALIPGTGEYGLATTPVHYGAEGDEQSSANVSTPAGKTDFAQSLECMSEELPNLEAASLVVSWFGDDLRCGVCSVRPKVENADVDGENMAWSVAGLARAQAGEIAQTGARPIYGGTPSDASVVEAIEAMNVAGKKVMFYPFILMDQLAGNTLPDPYSGGIGQPHLPWRGRITLSAAPGQDGSPDGTAAAEAEVAAFFGTATAADFAVGEGVVSYSGPQEWTLTRFILHYAALCKAAGGVEAFCISSEMRGLTQVRGAGGDFVAVERLRALAGEVRAILGPEVKISYAADWSEYFGYQPQDGSGDRLFHLDPLWADDDIDFIGIDNYMPLSDWREGVAHLDAQQWEAIYDLDYLKANIEGGEGFDWYYHSPEARAAQIRTAITDDAHDEPWVYRYKDLRGWWENEHHDRVDGQRIATPTAWVPQSKPIWFTEYGCAAVDKGPNQPNKFLDAKSTESALPYHSDGARDDLIQQLYLQAMIGHWGEEENNPTSDEYQGRMIDMSRAFVWAWDVRPFPFFPNNVDLWSDGENYGRGHWVNGRTSGRTLASVVTEVCLRAGLSLEMIDTSRLYGFVRGFEVDDVADGRALLQPLMLRHGFDAIEREGVLHFRNRDGRRAVVLDPAEFAVSADLEGATEQSRDAEAEVSGRVRVRFVQADGDFETLAEEAVLVDEATHAVSASDLNMAMTRAEGRQLAERWLTEARVARDTLKLALPPSMGALGAGDVIELPADQGENSSVYRIDRVEQTELQLIEAVRIEPEVYDMAPLPEVLPSPRRFVPALPVNPVFLDLPLMRGDEVPHTPHIAVSAQPWPGSVAVYHASADEDYRLNTTVGTRATMGVTLNALAAAQTGVFDRGAGLDVRLNSGTLQSVGEATLLSGANLAAIGDGSPDNWELFQFSEADLIAPSVYRLTGRLRGQLGSDALMPAIWPEGSRFVLLNGVPSQLDLGPNLRGIEQHYRIGPAQRGVDDPSYVHRVEAFAGNGLRPLSPVHLRAVASGGDIGLSWVRRTRLEGDSWEGSDVPLAEESERYHLSVWHNAALVREIEVSEATWAYTAAMQADDGVSGAVEVRVAQVSASYGAGLAARLGVSV